MLGLIATTGGAIGGTILGLIIVWRMWDGIMNIVKGPQYRGQDGKAYRSKNGGIRPAE